MPEKTAETLDKDGWLHTGDIGIIQAVSTVMWDNRLAMGEFQNVLPKILKPNIFFSFQNGTLKIVDRKKNIFKLAQVILHNFLFQYFHL